MSLSGRYLGKYRWRLFLFVLLSVCSVLFTMATALSVADFLKLLFDAENTVPSVVTAGNLVTQALSYLYVWLIGFGRWKALLYFSIWVFVLYALKNVAGYAAAVTMASTRAYVVRDLRNDMMERLQKQSMLRFGAQRKGDMLARMSGDLTEYDENTLGSIQTLTTSVIGLLLYLAMLAYINVKLTIGVLCALPLVAFVISGITRHLRRESVEAQEQGAQLMSTLEETVMGLKIIKAYTAIDFANRRYRQQNSRYQRSRMKLYRRVDLSSPVSDFLGNTIVIGILLMGSYWVLQGDHGLTPELFVSYIMLFVLMIPPAKDLSTAFSQIRKGKGCEARLQQVLDEVGEVDDGTRSLTFEHGEASIVFENVSFAYQSDVPVLKHIDIVIERGKKIALVGSSGSGKSTMAHLLTRLYPVTSGRLLIGGYPIEEYSLGSLRTRIGVVSQETQLFNDTVANNIAFGYPEATREEIQIAAKTAHAHDFIVAMEQGYDTVIGEGGSRLSGGQRQRISIARALLRQPDILILDEATSALDTVSEREVQAALDDAMKDRTAVIIAHRLSTIVGVDEIVVLEQGEIVERGSHRALLEQEGRYYRLVQLQEVSQ